VVVSKRLSKELAGELLEARGAVDAVQYKTATHVHPMDLHPSAAPWGGGALAVAF
jgi:hypothetical protein